MKGLILSGGKGTRLYPLTYTRAKQMMPLANKPVLFRVIETIRDAGITEIGIIVGDTAPEIREAVGDGSRFGVRVTYIPQDAPRGLAHAVHIGRDFIGDERFVVFLGDNVIQGGISPLIADFANHPEWNSQIVLTAVEQPEHYGIAKLGADGRVEQLIEKPGRNPKYKVAPSNLALVGIYMFDAHIFEAVQHIQPSFRGELEITDAIQWLIDNGYNVFPHVHQGWWIDTGKPIDMLRANSLVLEELKPHIDGSIDSSSQVDQRVTVERGAQIINSVVRGPAIIGEEVRIVNSYIGPFTSIYHHTVIENCEIEYSIVLEHSLIQDIETRIQDSLIGRNVVLCRNGGRPRVLSLTLGDHSKVSLL
ncbi:MAG: glucose-1-phosphate thymidylyltransferase [Candidatus Thermofonsia Clade 1 bacterium]|jgi:glucose-1-phosphate thymidylyltransferase|uniref:Glucose-1-phosphate thymidylyltransferase n=1 Tax=Candidatus Thermofonsia Clade 1 bacterium TaxID=2364210 RepID=A0A2M8PDT1_9CHLR|nr:MAG: glucose-1-phosphate thymidylyltransferase [Candidatus Thermofonsia Clade 1 bacterium]PJF42803.1 MAG: glucose-1-phosphate thymidylyltransferase [Candidatus Thermofonsia Clade 1 bacterium]RMF48801.1 MAG: glucose-1-phosphate thymidylyltransferase [Chloroflexota bacterium]